MITREEMITKLKEDGYTDYAINNIIDERLKDANKEDIQDSMNERELMLNLSAIRNALEYLNKRNLSFKLETMGDLFTEHTSRDKLNTRINELQCSVLRQIREEQNKKILVYDVGVKKVIADLADSLTDIDEVIGDE